MKIVCPRCLGKNVTGNIILGVRCIHCNYYFSPEDIHNKLEWTKDREDVQEVQIGSGSFNFGDDDFWGGNNPELYS